MPSEVELGIGKTARRAYGFDEISIVPSRRTRDANEVKLQWEIDAFQFDLPVATVPTDSVVSPQTAIAIGKLGGLGILHLEGLWTRHENPEPLLEEIADTSDDKCVQKMQELYSEPIKAELIVERIREIKASGVTACAAISPNEVVRFRKELVESELDLLTIYGSVVSAEHVSRSMEALDLKKFIREFELPVLVGGCSSYQTALHLMRTGAVGVLVGDSSGSTRVTHNVLGIGVPLATAIADASGARMRHLHETGVYVHVIANGGITTNGEMSKAFAMGADAVALGLPLASANESPGHGYHWNQAATNSDLPRGSREKASPVGSLQEILHGPARDGEGQTNLIGALRRTMAATGYESVREFQKAEVVVTEPL